MPFGEFHYASAALRKAVSLNVVLPSGEGPFPVVYLLHGLSDNHTNWVRFTSIERYAEAAGLMVVMPDGGRGFYTDMENGAAYASAIIEDAVRFVDATFRTIPERRARGIGGLSMGGYGAVKLALTHPELFASATSHSGAFDFGNRPRVYGNDDEVDRLLAGGAPVPHDIFRVAEEAAASGAPLPALRLDCGTEDFLIEANRDFHAHLEELGIAHEYAEFPGGHEWPYWDRHVPAALAFHARHLVARAPSTSS